MESSKKWKVLAWSVVGILVVVTGGYFGIRAMVRSNHLKPFEPKVDEYLAKPVASKERPDARHKGKIIPVNVKEKEIDSLYWDLPEGLRAATPDDVATIVWLEWGEVQVSTYGNTNKPALVQTCNVTVIDRDEKAILLREAFRGSDPPKSIKSRDSSGRGDKPTDKVVEFLQQHQQK